MKTVTEAEILADDELLAEALLGAVVTSIWRYVRKSSSQFSTLLRFNKHVAEAARRLLERMRDE